MALKAEELRSGNVVHQGKLYGNGPISAYQILKYESFLKGATSAEYYSEWKPIETCQDELKRLGFIFVGDENADIWRSPLEELFEIEFGSFQEMIEAPDKDKYHIWDATYTGAPIPFIHDVQNLHRALTGKELIYTAE